MFDKAKYWVNRKAGLRGQGVIAHHNFKRDADNYDNPLAEKYFNDSDKHNGHGMFGHNRRWHRAKDRTTFTIIGIQRYPGDDGRREITHTRKGAPHQNVRPENTTREKWNERDNPIDPAMTNHERHVARANLRAQLRATV